jgi:nitrate reductase NapAB chaperone NapD
MEQALILGKLSNRVPRDLIQNIKKIKSVIHANLIYGPYDFYAVVNTETKEMLSDTVLQIRSYVGVQDTMTCYAIELSDIRPEAKGPYVE